MHSACPHAIKPRRILIVDGESPSGRLRDDLRKMLRRIKNPALARVNFIVVVDAFIKDEPLCLSKPQHFKWLMAIAKQYQADLIIIDTVSTFLS